MKPARIKKRYIIIPVLVLLFLFTLSLGFFLPPDLTLPEIPENTNMESRIRNRIADILHEGGESTIVLKEWELNALANSNIYRINQASFRQFQTRKVYLKTHPDSLTAVLYGRFLRFFPMYITADMTFEVTGNHILIEPFNLYIGRNLMNKYISLSEPRSYITRPAVDTFYTFNTQDYQINVKIVDISITEEEMAVTVRCTLR